MVKNGTPYLAMRLSPVYRLELSKNLILSEATKSKFPLIEKMDEIFRNGIVYDKKINLIGKKIKKETSINITNLMEIINHLELDYDDNIESIISKYI